MKNITALFLIIISIGIFFTLTRPTYGDIKENQAKAAGYKDVLDNISDIIETRDRLLLSYNDIPRAELDRLSKVLPENVDTVRFATDLDGIASKYGISIKEVAIDKDANRNASQVVLPGNESPFETTLVSVVFVSNYENFRKFMEDLEKNLRIMNVKTISFQTEESGLYEHTLLLETYWVK